MLHLMNSVERISQIIPKFKQQLIFLEQREKLFNRKNGSSILVDESSSDASTTSQATPIVANNYPLSAGVLPSVDASTSRDSVRTIHSLLQISTDPSTFDESSVGDDTNVVFPSVYQILPLPRVLIKDIENGCLDKFGPYCSNRQVLIDTVVHDLIENYNLL